MFIIEDYYVIFFEDIVNVEWCFKFVKLEIRGCVMGGKVLFYYICCYCRCLCFYLFGCFGMGRRFCLGCYGFVVWEKKLIFEWYYYNSCKYCG